MSPQSILDHIYNGRMLIFGHRGASAYAPMNTLPAFELAAEQGADGVELDVHFSKDKQLIVLHDFTIDHTTNGTGYARDMTLAQLKALDAGSWKGEQYKGVQIPTLDEVFDAIGQKLFVNVEIKSETEETDGVEQAVADCLQRKNMQERVIISSFNPLALKRFREIMPDVPIGYLYVAEAQPFAEVMETLPHEARHPHHPMIDQEYMDWAKSKGYRVNTWTVNDPARAIELKRLGVDAIITDTPDVMREALYG
ncbi:MAG: glycerophosphodiester phosphodiesterase [Chloroflexota bacterium]